MSEKRFRENFDVSIYDSETEEYISASENGLKEIAKRMNEQQATITKLRNENIILKNKIEELRDSLFMQDKELQRQMQKSDLNE